MRHCSFPATVVVRACLVCAVLLRGGPRNVYLSRFPAIASVHCALRPLSGRLFLALFLNFFSSVCVCDLSRVWLSPKTAPCCFSARRRWMLRRLAPHPSKIRAAERSRLSHSVQPWSINTDFIFNSVKFPLSRPAGQNQRLCVTSRPWSFLFLRLRRLELAVTDVAPSPVEQLANSRCFSSHRRRLRVCL